MNENFRSKCKSLSERLDILNKLLTELKQQIIIRELSIELDAQIEVGRHLFSDIDWLEETVVRGESFTLINKSEEKSFSYVIYTKKEYHTMGLGFIYKKDIVTPHMDFCVEEIISKYSNIELNEIIKLIDEAMANINHDIEYLNSNSDICTHEHYYGEYNKGFDSHYRFETISDVIDDYKKS